MLHGFAAVVNAGHGGGVLARSRYRVYPILTSARQDWRMPEGWANAHYLGPCEGAPKYP